MYLEDLVFCIKRAGWKVTKINSHITFKQARFKQKFILMNQKTFINRYHNIFDSKVSQFVTSDLLKADVEEKYNDTLLKLDKEDRFYEIKLQTIKTERLQQLEAAEKFDKQTKKNKKEQN